MNYFIQEKKNFRNFSAKIKWVYIPAIPLSASKISVFQLIRPSFNLSPGRYTSWVLYYQCLMPDKALFSKHRQIPFEIHKHCSWLFIVGGIFLFFFVPKLFRLQLFIIFIPVFFFFLKIFLKHFYFFLEFFFLLFIFFSSDFTNFFFFSLSLFFLLFSVVPLIFQLLTFFFFFFFLNTCFSIF